MKRISSIVLAVLLTAAAVYGQTASRVTVQNTATLLIEATAAQSVAIKNPGAVDVYIGGTSAVTTSTGFKLSQGETITISLGRSQTVYGIVTSSTQEVQLFRAPGNITARAGLNGGGSGTFSVVNATTGFEVNGAATSGRYLKGDGTNFVQSSGNAGGTGSCTNQFVTATNSDAAPTCATVDMQTAQVANVWSSRTFTAGDFTASTGSWTLQSGDQQTFKYIIIGKMMTVALWLDLTTISNDTANLIVLIPGGNIATARFQSGMTYITAGTTGNGRCLTLASDAHIYFQRDAGVPANFTAGTNNTSVNCTITFEIQ